MDRESCLEFVVQTRDLDHCERCGCREEWHQARRTEQKGADREADLIAEWLASADSPGRSGRAADDIRAREHRAWDKRRKERK